MQNIAIIICHITNLEAFMTVILEVVLRIATSDSVVVGC